MTKTGHDESAPSENVTEAEQNFLKRFALKKVTVPKKKLQDVVNLTVKNEDDGLKEWLNPNYKVPKETTKKCERLEYRDLSKVMRANTPWWLGSRGVLNNYSGQRLVSLVEVKDDGSKCENERLEAGVEKDFRKNSQCSVDVAEILSMGLEVCITDTGPSVRKPTKKPSRTASKYHISDYIEKCQKTKDSQDDSKASCSKSVEKNANEEETKREKKSQIGKKGENLTFVKNLDKENNKKVDLKEEIEVETENESESESESESGGECEFEFLTTTVCKVIDETESDNKLQVSSAKSTDMAWIEERLNRVQNLLMSLEDLRLQSGCEKCQGREQEVNCNSYRSHGYRGVNGSRRGSAHANGLDRFSAPCCNDVLNFAKDLLELDSKTFDNNHQASGAVVRARICKCDLDIISGEMEGLCCYLEDLAKKKSSTIEKSHFDAIIKRVHQIRQSFCKLSNKILGDSRNDSAAPSQIFSDCEKYGPKPKHPRTANSRSFDDADYYGQKHKSHPSIEFQDLEEVDKYSQQSKAASALRPHNFSDSEMLERRHYSHFKDGFQNFDEADKCGPQSEVNSVSRSRFFQDAEINKQKQHCHQISGLQDFQEADIYSQQSKSNSAARSQIFEDDVINGRRQYSQPNNGFQGFESADKYSQQPKKNCVPKSQCYQDTSMYDRKQCSHSAMGFPSFENQSLKGNIASRSKVYHNVNKCNQRENSNSFVSYEDTNDCIPTQQRPPIFGSNSPTLKINPIEDTQSEFSKECSEFKIIERYTDFAEIPNAAACCCSEKTSKVSPAADSMFLDPPAAWCEQAQEDAKGGCTPEMVFVPCFYYNPSTGECKFKETKKLRPKSQKVALETDYATGSTSDYRQQCHCCACEPSIDDVPYRRKCPIDATDLFAPTSSTKTLKSKKKKEKKVEKKKESQLCRCGNVEDGNKEEEAINRNLAIISKLPCKPRKLASGQQNESLRYKARYVGEILTEDMRTSQQRIDYRNGENMTPSSNVQECRCCCKEMQENAPPGSGAILTACRCRSRGAGYIAPDEDAASSKTVGSSNEHQQTLKEPTIIRIKTQCCCPPKEQAADHLRKQGQVPSRRQSVVVRSTARKDYTPMSNYEGQQAVVQELKRRFSQETLKEAKLESAGPSLHSQRRTSKELPGRRNQEQNGSQGSSRTELLKLKQELDSNDRQKKESKTNQVLKKKLSFEPQSRGKRALESKTSLGNQSRTSLQRQGFIKQEPQNGQKSEYQKSSNTRVKDTFIPEPETIHNRLRESPKNESPKITNSPKKQSSIILQHPLTVKISIQDTSKRRNQAKLKSSLSSEYNIKSPRPTVSFKQQPDERPAQNTNGNSLGKQENFSKKIGDVCKTLCDSSFRTLSNAREQYYDNPTDPNKQMCEIPCETICYLCKNSCDIYPDDAFPENFELNDDNENGYLQERDDVGRSFSPKADQKPKGTDRGLKRTENREKRINEDSDYVEENESQSGSRSPREYYRHKSTEDEDKEKHDESDFDEENESKNGNRLPREYYTRDESDFDEENESPNENERSRKNYGRKLTNNREKSEHENNNYDDDNTSQNGNRSPGEYYTTKDQTKRCVCKCHRDNRFDQSNSKLKLNENQKKSAHKNLLQKQKEQPFKQADEFENNEDMDTPSKTTLKDSQENEDLEKNEGLSKKSAEESVAKLTQGKQENKDLKENENIQKKPSKEPLKKSSQSSQEGEDQGRDKDLSKKPTQEDSHGNEDSKQNEPLNRQPSKEPPNKSSQDSNESKNEDQKQKQNENHSKKTTNEPSTKSAQESQEELTRKCNRELLANYEICNSDTIKPKVDIGVRDTLSSLASFVIECELPNKPPAPIKEARESRSLQDIKICMNDVNVKDSNASVKSHSAGDAPKKLHGECCCCEGVPPIEGDLGTIIQNRIKNRKRGTVYLKFTMNSNNLFHIQMATTDNEFLGCFYATENAVMEARRTNGFDGCVTLTVMEPSNSSSQVSRLVDHAFMVVQQDRKTQS